MWSEIPSKDVDKLMQHYGLSKNTPATPAKITSDDAPTAATAPPVQQAQQKDEVVQTERRKVSQVPMLPPISAL